MKMKKRFNVFLSVMISAVLVSFAFFSVFQGVNRCIDFCADSALVSAYIAMPNGEFNEKTASQKKAEVKKPMKNTDKNESEKLNDTYADTNENKYPIQEIDLSSNSKLYENISLRNTTSYSVDAKSMLEKDLPFEIKDTREAQVLIVHTHTCESYMDSDSGFYYESFYPRTTDNEKNVAAVGEEISDSLKAHGIGVVHATVQHDHPSYDGAYDRSYNTIQSYLDKYSEIKVVLDIHRDSMTNDSMTKFKPTFDYNGKKAAQIMIMAGHDESGADFPMWEDNLNFALKLQNTCETMYEGFTRPLYFGDFTYNMNVNSGSLLIEVGTDANTLQEALLSGELLGNALAQVLQKS